MPSPVPFFEEQFSNNSFGFRPRRSAHGALQKARADITEGYRFVVDMDLANKQELWWREYLKTAQKVYPKAARCEEI